jgi:hypothetical protein
MAADDFVAQEPGAVLRAGGEVQLSLCGLCSFASWIAAVCGVALPELVSASDPETSKLEGTDVSVRAANS